MKLIEPLDRKLSAIPKSGQLKGGDAPKDLLSLFLLKYQRCGIQPDAGNGIHSTWISGV